MVGPARRCWFRREVRILGGADALPEQPRAVLLSRANDLVFRAKVRSLSLERPYSIQLVQIGMTDEQPGLQRIQTGAKGLPLFQRR
jgi:hypothetical protein